MKDLNVILAGFGGQGILFLGKAIAYAGMLQGREVTWLPSYGPEMRGGTADCSVRISDEGIDSPVILAPDAQVVMNLPSFEKYIPMAAPGSMALVESSLIDKKVEREDITVYYVPATALAEENGLSGLANIIMLGKLMTVTDFCTQEEMQTTIEKIVPPRKAHLVEKNMLAIRLGANS